MASNIKVVLFEDTEKYRSRILEKLKKHLGTKAEVISFDGSQIEEESDADKKRTYEDRLEGILTKAPYDGATLIVADRDLSKGIDSDFRGLSANAVIAVSKRLFIPICSYARQPERDDYDWRGQWEEGHIVLSLSDGEDELARRVAIAARGFAEIRVGLPKVMKNNNSPANILAALLGKPEYSPKIALYSVGDQNRLSVVLTKSKPKKQVQMMAYFLGYWLWDSLLRYPGLFVNEVAAASYLNIETDDFRKTEVQVLFKKALYRGPFSDSEEPQWWRGMLDDIVSQENCTDGLAFVQKKLRSKKIRGSQCWVDPRKSAGYYCIISKKPVSLENSKGGLSWFPRGADLTRISNKIFDEYGPWLGA